VTDSDDIFPSGFRMESKFLLTQEVCSCTFALADAFKGSFLCPASP